MTAVSGRAAPDRPNVLITSASRKVTLVRAFREAMARLAGGRVLATDISPWAVALQDAHEAVRLPRSDEPGFESALERLCEDERIGLVVPTRDDELPMMAAARERLAGAGTMVLVSSPEAVATCRDKVRFAEAVQAAGLDCPRMYVPPDVQLPAFVKPRSGAGGRGATAVSTVQGLEAAVASILAAGGEPLVQEFVDATEFTIDVFIDPDGQPISCVPRERVVVVAGESVVSRTVRYPDLATATLRLCATLALTGHLTVQAFRSPERIVFVEINPRFGGGANLGFAAGAHTPELAIRVARGERLVPQLDEYEVDLVMLRYGEDRIMRGSEVGSLEARR